MVAVDVMSQVGAKLAANDFEGALTAAEAAYREPATQVDAICVLAALSFRQGELANALQLLETVVEVPAISGDVLEALAVLNCLVGRLTEALYFAKLGTTNPVDNRLLPLFGPSLPPFADAFSTIGERPLLRKARMALQGGNLVSARALAEQHLSVIPNDIDGLDVLASIMEMQGETESAIALLRTVTTLGGQSATLMSRLGRCLTEIGEIDAGMACHDLALARAPKALALVSAALRDWRSHPHAGGPRYQACLEHWRQLINAKAPKVVRPLPAHSGSGRLSIAYVVAGVADPEVKAMIGRIAARHDRDKTIVIGFGTGDLGDQANAAYRNAFDRWREIGQLDELTLAALVRGESVDVVIDCDGLEGPNHHALFLRNAARLQLNWLGMPSGEALPGAHGSLAAGGLSSGPLLFSARDGRPTPLPAKAGQGGITFGTGMRAAEFNADVALVWALLLQRVEGSTLLLLDDGHLTRPERMQQLIDMFGNFGVAHRLDILQGDTESFWTQVDIGLAPFPSASPFAYGDALAAGVPVMVMDRGSARDLAAAVRATGEGETMVATDTADYVEKAIGWIADLDRLAAFRAEAPARIQASAPFNPTAFAANLDAELRRMLAERAAS